MVAEWFYTSKGKSLGPVSRDRIEELIERGVINGDTKFWTAGNDGWIPLHQSPFGRLSVNPPPISKQDVSNIFVWLVALLPLLVAIIEVAPLEGMRDAVISGDIKSLMFAQQAGQWVSLWQEKYEFLTFFVLNSVFSICDMRIVRNAGYSVKLLPISCLLVPVYLFVRASRVKQIPYYGIVWIVCILIKANAK